MTNKSDSGLQQAYGFLKSANPDKAKPILEDVLSDDLENREVLFALKCCNFWIQKMPGIQAVSNAFERGVQLIEQWKSFTTCTASEGFDHEKTMYAVRKGVFSFALECFKAPQKDNGDVQKAETFSKIGLCHKKLGDYDTALRFLCDANALLPGSSAILAEMADCNALCGEERKAKVLFREAFFVNIHQIDIDLLESELFSKLYDLVRNSGKAVSVHKEWLPVYGVLFGILSIKRELRAVEVGKLKQAIYALENELKDAAETSEDLIPRLINHYFWLIDHYIAVNENRSKINEVLLKIKILDSSVYEKYTV